MLRDKAQLGRVPSSVVSASSTTEKSGSGPCMFKSPRCIEAREIVVIEISCPNSGFRSTSINLTKTIKLLLSQKKFVARDKHPVGTVRHHSIHAERCARINQLERLSATNYVALDVQCLEIGCVSPGASFERHC